MNMAGSQQTIWTLKTQVGAQVCKRLVAQVCKQSSRTAAQRSVARPLLRVEEGPAS